MPPSLPCLGLGLPGTTEPWGRDWPGPCRVPSPVQPMGNSIHFFFFSFSFSFSSSSSSSSPSPSPSPPLLFFFFFFNLIVFSMLLVSGVQQSDSVIHIFFSQIFFPYRLLQNIEYSSLCYTVGPCWLSILLHSLLVHWCSLCPLPLLAYQELRGQWRGHQSLNLAPHLTWPWRIERICTYAED